MYRSGAELETEVYFLIPFFFTLEDAIEKSGEPDQYAALTRVFLYRDARWRRTCGLRRTRDPQSTSEQPNLIKKKTYRADESRTTLPSSGN